MSASTTTYQYGGALAPDHHYYIARKADDQLLELCLRSEFAHIFNARQTGKSSLLARTCYELEKRGIKAVLVDLQSLGTVADADSWYYNVARIIASKMELNTDLKSWWASQASLTPTYRWIVFFEQVVLSGDTSPIVVFIDEIDRTRPLRFRDDIFSALRLMYNERATQPTLRRLTFVLAGLATPQELIGDVGQTTYNIGEAVELADLTEKEGNVKKLAQGLGFPTAKKGQKALNWVLSWTGGHPYLTQKLCALVARQRWSKCSAKDIDRLVYDEFLSGEKEEPNLLYVERELVKERTDEGVTSEAVLGEFERVLDGRLLDVNSLPQIELKLTGVVKVENGQLQIRNRIYKKVFDRAWLHHVYRPPFRERWRRFQRRASVFMSRLALLLIALLLIIVSVPLLRELAQEFANRLLMLLK